MFSPSEMPAIFAQFGGGGHQPSPILLYVIVIAACAIGTMIVYAVYSRPRFSLRTLLIFTTLVAVGLGLFVWLR